ncbi:MAG: hypothetical protein AAFP15_16525 [Bacteroidota bacterium]
MTTPAEIQAAVKRWGSARAAAEVLGLSRQYVCRVMNETSPVQWKTKHGQRCAHRYTDEEKRRAIAMYEDGELIDDIEAETGISPRRIRQLVEADGVTVRPQGQQRALSYAEAKETYDRFGSYAAVAQIHGVAASTARRTILRGAQ